jgi:beta-lactamase regulating signal transducer with metallopeptidase domain
MSTFAIDSTVSAALWIVFKASVFVGVVSLVQLALSRRASAATRHLVWTLAIAGLLALPLGSVVLPEWAVPILTPPSSTAPAPSVPSVLAPSEPQAAPGPLSPADPAGDSPLSAFRTSGISWFTAIAAGYVVGVVSCTLLLLVQRWRLRQFARQASPVDDAVWRQLVEECARRMGVRRPVRLLRSRERNVPVAFGTRRPAIVIPAVSDTWTGDRRRAVVLHELAHVARHDCLTQTLAAAVCAIYWFHPAAWWVARRLRIERELACDDRVIAAGTEAREYAGHLLEIAYSFGNHRAPALAVGMARRHHIEGRLLAALDAARNRSVPAPRARLATALVAAMLLYPLATFTPATAAAQPDADSVAAPAGTFAHDQDGLVKPYLRSVKTSVKDARSLVRGASAAMGLTQDAAPGTWEIRPTSTEGTVHLRLVELNSSSGSNVRIDRLEGLTAAQLSGAGGPVQFRLRSDAGTFTFEGVIKQGVGAGTFSFTPNPAFGGELAKRGFSQPTPSEQYQLARHDVGYEFIDELNKQGYSKTPTAELVRAGQHGVHITYLREMGALGYKLGTLPPLIELRDHGVTPDYVRALAEEGYKGLSADELRNARDHGVSAEFVRAMREAGYGSLPMAALVNARDHGVSPEFVRALGEAGYRNLPLEQLVRARDHGVSPEYVRDLKQLGYTLSIDELVKARDHGVSVEFVREMASLGYAKLPIDALIRARDHGVSVEFVREMASLGYAKLPLDALIRLRDHGVSAEYAKELKALGYDALPYEDLIMLRDHGLTPDRIRSANARAGTRLPIELLKSLAR